ncbi:MAG: hypothetical protein U0X86_000775 [Wolbachia endosymbiont of Xenopsylla cheopis]
MPNNKPIDFFDKPFKEQVETIIKIGDLRSLQALIGVRNAAALSRYCASFFITKVNITYAEQQGTLKVLEKLLKSYLHKMKQESWVPEQVKQHSSNMFKDCVSESENELLEKIKFLPAINNNEPAIDGELSDMSPYVRKDNLRSLCLMDNGQITEIYRNFVDSSQVEERLKLSLADKTRLEAIAFLEREKSDITDQLEALRKEEEVTRCENLLYKIKQGLFLNGWYKKLVYQVLEEALADKKHPFHNKVNHHYKINSNKLAEGSKKLIMEELRILWNKELIRRVLNKIVEKDVTITDKSYKEDAIKELLEIINLRSEYIAYSVFRNLEPLKEFYGNSDTGRKLENTDEKKKYMVQKFSAALLIEEEQSVLKEMLLYAIDQKQNDIALLLICNEVDYKDCGNIDLPEEIAPLEIKRLYKDMPEIKLPVLSLGEIRASFPDEDVMNKIASYILEQEERLIVGTPESTEEEKRKLVNKNIKEVLSKEYPWYIRFYYALKKKKSKLEKVERALSIVEEVNKSFKESASSCADPKPFFKELKEIERKDKVRLNEKFFERLHKIKNNKSGNILTFKKLAEEIVNSKKEIIKEEGKKAATIDVYKRNEELGLKVSNLKDELEKSNTQNKSIATRLTSADAKIEEERVRAEEERAAREEAEAKAEEAEAEKKARDMVADEVDEREISFKKVNIKGAREFFIAQFKLVVLYESLKDKLQDQAHKCVQLRKELIDCEVIVDRVAQNPEEISKQDVFERRLNLIKESDKIDEKLKKLNEECVQKKATFENEKIEEFKNDALKKVAQVKEEVENLRQMLQVEQEKVEIVEADKLQAQAESLPDSNMSKAEIQSHQNIASKIA